MTANERKAEKFIRALQPLAAEAFRQREIDDRWRIIASSLDAAVKLAFAMSRNPKP